MEHRARKGALMAKESDAEILTQVLRDITIQELVDLNEEDTVRLSLAFEEFVDKIAEVVRRAHKDQRRMIN